jgi:hypothetical protein
MGRIRCSTCHEEVLFQRLQNHFSGGWASYLRMEIEQLVKKYSWIAFSWGGRYSGGVGFYPDTRIAVSPARFLCLGCIIDYLGR